MVTRFVATRRDKGMKSSSPEGCGAQVETLFLHDRAIVVVKGRRVELSDHILHDPLRVCEAGSAVLAAAFKMSKGLSIPLLAS